VLFVETRGSTLEEMAVLFDGKHEIDHLRVHALVKKAEGRDTEVIQVEDAEAPRSSAYENPAPVILFARQ
jgi:hypothetical protein